MDVAGFAAKERMVRHLDLDHRVARRAAIEAGTALVAQPEGLAVVQPDRDLDIQGAPVRKTQTAGGAIHDIEQVDRQTVQFVTPLDRTGTAAPCLPPVLVAKDGSENVAQFVVIHAPATGGIPGCAGIRAVAPARRALREITVLRTFRPGRLTVRIDFATIEGSTFLHVGKQVVGGGDSLKGGLRGFVAWVEVRMV